MGAYVRIKPKTRWAEHYYAHHMKHDARMDIVDKKDKWLLCNITYGITFWGDPVNDKNWEIVR